MRHGWTAMTGAMVAATLFTGCGVVRGSDEQVAVERHQVSPTSDATDPTDRPSAGAPSAIVASAFPDTTQRQQAKSSRRAELTFTDVRVVRRDGFSCVVLRFSGRGVPGWVVNYVDEAVQDGSGEVVDLDGDAFLDIFASGTTWPGPGYYDGPQRFSPQEGGIAEVYVGGTFEGYTQVILGLDGDATPFRVFTRSGPTRLIVDVEDTDAD